MTERLATTPFGGGQMSARLFARQMAVSRRQEELAKVSGGNDGAPADKWQLLRALTEARAVYGLSDRTIMLLEALVSFTPERELDGRQPIIVFPSNRELSLRARGMAPATIRRHLAALVDAGMVFRRDSANGKRYCRRGDDGQVEDAFGFDLAPLALQASEIYEHAEAARAEAKAVRAIRAEITLHQRDLSKIIEIALEEGRQGDWPGFTERLARLTPPLSRNAPLSLLKGLREELLYLRGEVEDSYLQSISEEEMSANDRHSERHHQNSNADQISESSGNEKMDVAGILQEKAAPEQKAAISLKKLRRICPEIWEYARDGVSSWADLIKTADLVRSMLGVSPDAWAKARSAMGEQQAAVVIAAILERSDTIRSPGGYLRDLTRKAEAGAFSILPMLNALDRKQE
ncbi:plasmid replication protein RepC [Rhizobium sp. L1K21]|uniref:plasmid replication protein RepC n=1 Tax=Rhizobium sp. L1K21 TaxID=2954933 RepID=UPI002092B21A|nr:plasmid replication protein RepC [Rhizobium sp. L1K21]MCO6188361.1 replication initiation protein RepC [Rhizobium sp. L1K21]